ncbi:MAG TPA: YfiR family protein [Desulfuromonadaceae bacterium]|nr:YfiR family protein [Desulfuromonadaceae bacterium]
MPFLKTLMRLASSRKNRLCLCLLLGCLLAGASKVSAQTVSSKEIQIKAVFLFNFAEFVEWPTNAFVDPHAPLVIGVLGEDPFGSFLDDTVRGETVNGHPLAVRRYQDVSEIKDCHILFISRSEADRLEQIVAALKDRNILTVGDFDGFAQRGGIIRFVTDKKIHLRINLEMAKAANLTISSKLLRPSEIVQAGKD